MKGLKLPLRLVLSVLVMLGAIGGTAYAVDWGLKEIDRLQRATDDTRVRISNLRRKMREQQAELAEVGKLIERFEAAKTAGFLDPQDRMVAVRRMSRLQDQFGIRKPEFTFDPQRVLEERTVDKHVLVAGRVSLTGTALLDRDMIAYWDSVMREMPGAEALVSLQLSRTGDLDRDALFALVRGDEVSRVAGSLVFDWVSLVPAGSAAP